MRKVIFGLLILTAACRSAPPATGPTRGSQTGAADAASAVNAFISAGKAQDLQAMSVVWGTRQGAIRDRIPREEMEVRQIIIIRCLSNHDTHRILREELRPEGRRAVFVELVRGGLTRPHTFDVVQGPRGRWYVESFDLDLGSEFCRAPRR